MNKITSTLLAATLMCATTLAFADHDKDHDKGHDSKHHKDHMAAMDTNNDGFISKDEFMTFHVAMWDKLTKNKDGLVSIKDMQHMHGHHMHDDKKMDKDEKKDH